MLAYLGCVSTHDGTMFEHKNPRDYLVQMLHLASTAVIVAHVALYKCYDVTRHAEITYNTILALYCTVCGM
jgi:hypothetical protein